MRHLWTTGPQAPIMGLALKKHRSGVANIINSLKEHICDLQTVLALISVSWDLDLVLIFLT